MKNIKSILLSVSMFASVSSLYAATVDYGYSAEEPVQFSAAAYSTTNYAVIQIPADVAAKYAGANITGVKLMCQTYTSNKVDVNTVQAFVAEDLENFSPSVIKDATVTGKVWNSVSFDEPYVISGDKDIYVGYSMKAGRYSDTMPVAIDAGPATVYGDILGYKDTRNNYYWEHAGDSGDGNVLVKAMIEGDNMPDGNLVVLSALGEKIVKPGDDFSVSCLIFNYGAKPMDAFSLSCRFDGVEIASKAFENGLAAGNSATHVFSGLSISEEKEAELSIVPVSAGDDAVSFSYMLDCTRAMLPRTVLVEEFSTAQCSNCPPAHRALASVSADRDDMIVVAHHSGFYEDGYTTDLDRAYLWFFQTSSWAPAFMMDRVNFAEQGAVAQAGMNLTPSPGPVMFVSSADDIANFVDLAAERYAWLDVNIDYNYDPGTRKLDVVVSGTPVKVLDEWTNPVMNIFLVERSDVSYQSGVKELYTHRHIFRTTLTGNFGDPITLKKGEAYSYKTSVVIDEKLDAGDMDIVAFVSNNNTKDASDCKVFNSASVAIDTPSTGIDSIAGDSVKVTGSVSEINVEGDFSLAEIYALNGVKTAELTESGSVAMAAGVYLVKISVSGESITRKVIVK